MSAAHRLVVTAPTITRLYLLLQLPRVTAQKPLHTQVQDLRLVLRQILLNQPRRLLIRRYKTENPQRVCNQLKIQRWQRLLVKSLIGGVIG